MNTAARLLTAIGTIAGGVALGAMLTTAPSEPIDTSIPENTCNPSLSGCSDNGKWVEYP